MPWIIKARLGLTDEELIEQIKENPYLQFFIGLEAFQYSAPFDLSMMVYFRKRLPEAVVNDCNERIVRHGLNIIRSSDTQRPGDDNDSGSGSTNPADKSKLSPQKQSNQGSLLIDATCAPVDIRHPTDLSLLNEAREVTEILIDAMHPQVRESFGHKPRTHRKQARQQFLAVAKKKRPRINKIRKAIKQQLGHLKRNLSSIDALIACGGCLLAAGRHIYQKLLVGSVSWSASRPFSITQTAEASLIASSVSIKHISDRLSAGKLVAMLSLEPRFQSLSPARDSPSSIA